jgi:hypothetical protein
MVEFQASLAEVAATKGEHVRAAAAEKGSR